MCLLTSTCGSRNCHLVRHYKQYNRRMAYYCTSECDIWVGVRGGPFRICKAHKRITKGGVGTITHDMEKGYDGAESEWT